VKRFLAFLLALILASAGAVGILLLLQSRDDGTIERPPPARTSTSEQALP